jgi:hypothetical protein
MSTNTRNTRAAERYAEEIRRCPHSGSGVHSWMMTTANLAAIAGIPATDAEAEIVRAMTRPPSPASEVATAIRKAFSEYAPGADYTPRRYSTPKPKPLPKTREHFIQRGREIGGTEADWFHRSPVYLPEAEPGPQDALAVLRTLWPSYAQLFIGDRYGRKVEPVRDIITKIEGGAPVPPLIIPNPLSGGEHFTKDGKPSARCDAAVVSFWYAVAEMDDMSREDQLLFWAGFTSAPVAALIDSGGKSIHAWLWIDCPTREAWAADVRQGLFDRILIPLGCDRACQNESRLSRMPGHYRAEKGAWQRLLYLNPEAGR